MENAAETNLAGGISTSQMLVNSKKKKEEIYYWMAGEFEHLSVAGWFLKC